MNRTNGVNFNFTASNQTQYSDNSMNKTQRLTILTKKHLENLNKKSQKISKSKDYHKSLQTRIAQLEVDTNSLNLKFLKADAELIQLNKAATTIQRHIRGFLLRRKIDNEWYAMKKERLEELVSDISNSHHKYIYNTGRMPQIAAITIQRAVKRHFFYKKILRMKKVHLCMLELKEQETFRKIRETLRNLFCVNLVNFLKYEKYKNKKLKEIKLKLALLAIKRVFLREKMSWKIVRIRIRKYKRNIKIQPKKDTKKNFNITAEIQNATRKSVLLDKKPEIIVKRATFTEKRIESPEIPKNTQPSNLNSPSNNPKTTSESPKNDQTKHRENLIEAANKPADPLASLSRNHSNLLENPDPNLLKSPSGALKASPSQETIVTTTTEKEARVRAELLKKLEEERRVKVALGRISYNVRAKDENRILPYLKTISGNEPDFYPSSPSSIAKQKPVMIPPIKEKSDARKPDSFDKKKNYISGSYMKETLAYQFSKMDPNDLFEEDITTVIPVKVRNNSTLMAPTAAFVQKTMGNPSARSHSTETKTGEKLVIASKKFRSNILLEIPEQPEKKDQPPKKIPVLLNIKKQPAKEESPVNIPPISTRVSISFDEAFPEYSGFIQSYAKTAKKSKLEPIQYKGGKFSNVISFEI